MPKARFTRKVTHSATASRPNPPSNSPAKARAGSHSLDFPVVAIGASAGGLEALTLFVENLTPDFGMAYLIVEHLDPKHKSMLVELLSRKTPVPIEEVKSRTKVLKDHIYVIPPNRNMYLERGDVCLSPRGPSPARHMPIDVLFRSVGLECPNNCAGIVLSGTGSDGSMGIEEIKSAGGITFAQDQDSAKHDGMPRSAVATGQIDYVLSPEGIALELKRIAMHPYTNGKKISELSQETQLQRIFSMLRTRTSVDFRHYKQNTIKRRIFRRMALLKIEKIDQYLQVISANQKELDALYQDLLIKVTSFFREPSSFKVLHDVAFPAIAKTRVRREPVRVWVPACSSGEEVYSLAIALLEYLGESSSTTPIQIFGTDVSEVALERARTGIYIENIALDVSPERLNRWFIKVDRGYQIAKSIREMCIFAKQNVTSDPPFSKIDLISCRNLLIYLDTVLQSRVMPTFHYALKPGGFLMLGDSESVGSNLDLFSAVDKRAKIYTKKAVNPRPVVSFNRRLDGYSDEQPTAMPEPRLSPTIRQVADNFIVSRFDLVGVIVDSELKIVDFRGSTGDYLEPAPGRASLHLLKMARGHLGVELRSLIQQAKSSARPVRKEDIAFKPRGQKARNIGVEVAPIRENNTSAVHFLVLFEELNAPPTDTDKPPSSSSVERREEQNSDVAELGKELAATTSQLQSTIEEAEVTTEELKSANEEVMSSNEELQSTNEELETAKEELQSANEELTTVNDEVQARNNELNVLNNDLTNFLTSVNVPVVMLGADLKIRRFTPMTKHVFNLIPTDIGRPFSDIKPKVQVPRLDQLIKHVIDTVTVHEQEVMDDDGRYYQMSIRPYRTPENKLDGAVLVFLDIHSIKQASLLLEDAKSYAEAIVEAVFDPLLVLDSDFVIQRANSAFYRTFQTDARQTENRSLFALDKSQWDLAEVRRLLKATFEYPRKVHPLEITEHFSRIGQRSLLINARPLARKNGKRPLILVTIADITVRKRAEDEKAKLANEIGKERALFESVLRQIGIGVAIFEAPSGRMLLSNGEFKTIFRRRLPASTTVSSFRKIPASRITEGVKSGPNWPMERSLRKGHIVPYEELILRRKTKEQTTIQVSSTPVYNTRKEMMAVVALFQDVTERKRLKEQIVDVSGREQRRIAHDLHDGLGQELAAIVYRINALKAHLAKGNTPGAEEAGNIGALMEMALARTRDLVKVVQPVAIDSRGLMQSLRDLAQSTSRLYKVDCNFSCPRPVPVRDENIALHVYRIAQEAVHNAVKHGKPSKISVSLHRRRNMAELTITNDGSEFSPTKDNRNAGLGLHIMTYRASVLRGELTVTRHRPRGTLVNFLFRPNAAL